ncbi:hypothetical protein H8958_012982 [Nasalis larvatus]
MKVILCLEPGATRMHKPPLQTASAHTLQGRRATGCKGRHRFLQQQWAMGSEWGPGDAVLALGSHPALASVHRLFLKAFSDLEVDLSGAHRGGCLDVELIPVLADLHVRLGRSRHGHFPQHGVHTCAGCTTSSRHRASPPVSRPVGRCSYPNFRKRP